MSNVIVIGGGAAGMMAAYRAGSIGHNVTLLEKNEKLGKKIYITGKGRCNFTNASDAENILKNVVSNPKFLYSALYGFDSYALMDFFEEFGMSYKIERGNRAFPTSDHASDVTNTLKKAMESVGVTIKLNTSVSKLLVEEASIKGVVLSDGKKLLSDYVILATGGMSYPTTGSTGDGIRFARDFGHKIINPRPALVPFECAEDYIVRMQGLSLKNVELSVYGDKKKPIYKEFGEMLFTHFGVSGPLVLSASSVVGKNLSNNNLNAYIDLKPAISKEELDLRLIEIISSNINKKAKNIFSGLLPGKMIDVFDELLGFSDVKKCNEITKEERFAIIELIKAFPFTITSTRSFKEAIITQGGVSVLDINPSTMESKLIKGLYFAGEMIDIDAYTGGYNLQLAFSTGSLAGYLM